jgi:RNA polymerase sigma-70 factor (ECF subfamily)
MFATGTGEQNWVRLATTVNFITGKKQFRKFAGMNYTAEFISLRDPLRSYLYRLTTSREDADDLVQDTFIRVMEKSHSFSGKSTFKTWVFAIATNLARDRKRVQARWDLDVQDQCKAAAIARKDYQERMFSAFNSQAEKQFEIAEHINYCFTCISKNLAFEQQLAVVLKEFYDFQRHEIAEILGVTEGVVKHLLFEGRKALQEKYSQRCALINKNGPCYQCAELNDYFQEEHNSREKVKQLGLSPALAGEENLDIRFGLIHRLNPLNGNGAKLEETILQMLHETIGF